MQGGNGSVAGDAKIGPKGRLIEDPDPPPNVIHECLVEGEEFDVDDQTR